METENKTQEDYDEEMIEMVRKCPFLFDNARVDFKDLAKRQKAWEAIGKALGQRAEVVERRWMSLRNQYTKKIREEELRSLSGSRVPTWRRSHSMAWLKPFIKGRRRRKDVLRVGQMSEWSIRDHQSEFLANGLSGIPMLDLPENVILPRSIEYSLVQPTHSNGEASTSSQSPTWSHHPDNQEDRIAGKNFQGSSSSSSSYVRSFQSTGPSVNSNGGDERPNSPADYHSDNDDSREYKPFELCEVQENKDVVSMMGMVREVVRQELALEDEDAHFAKSIAQMLRRMDRPKKNKTKVRLLQLLSEIDEEEES